MRLPLRPGVYLMKNADGEIIYIGKAKKLKNRVSSYFGTDSGHSAKVKAMVGHVFDFDYVVVDSEFEALVLECSLIKQHSPKYNVLLKDDKGYTYIRVSAPPWRMISAVFRPKDDGAEYIGPFTGNWSIKKAVAEAQEIFALPNCSMSFPKDINRRARPCLNYFIKTCSAPCCGKIDLESYEKSVDDALEFLSGDKEKSVAELTRRMEQCAENLDFETSAILRDRIKTIERLGAKQKVVTENRTAKDVFAFALGAKKACLAVLRFRDGLLFDSESFITEKPDAGSADPGTETGTEEDGATGSAEFAEVFSQLVYTFYTIRSDVPPEILTAEETEDPEGLSRLLSEKRGGAVSLRTPVRGEGKKLAELALANAYEKLTETDRAKNPALAAAEELAGLLGLDKPPEYLESYDISHTAGRDAVGGMVVFRDGKPLRSAYRRFIISAEHAGDDYASLTEVLSRRFDEYEKAEDRTQGFGRLPDLILLDGGEGQVAAVKRLFEERNIDVPLFGLVKDGKHRTRAIASGGGEISIAEKRRCFTLVSQLQEEVHRYSIAYHRSKRSKNALAPVLTGLPGVGPKTARMMLKTLGSMEKIAAATPEELRSVPGIGEVTARRIYEAIHETK